MPTKAEEAQELALTALVGLLFDKDLKVEIRVEAAKLILNRPRFFVDDQYTEK